MLLDDSPHIELHDGQRHGVKPFEKVRLNLGGVPAQSKAILNAARLGLELENDVRIATERLAELKHPRIISRFIPPPIHEPRLSERLTEPQPMVRVIHDTNGLLDVVDNIQPIQPQDPDDESKNMPLL
jgi:hypothetical protein